MTVTTDAFLAMTPIPYSQARPQLHTAQLRAEYGADLAEEIMANCGIEIAFAPKELKVAQDLSERLGTWTYAGRSKSRPALFSSGTEAPQSLTNGGR
ncbi:MAG TPA: TraM recognition domain-containing protein [Caulobacteraceae bacterium]|nr:TraM recognition domain-containing protein [Caulobacteraceae bacterium]